MNKYVMGSALAALMLAPCARTAETRYWTQSEQGDFEKGNWKKLTLRNDGRLRLAPVVTEMLDASTPYLWTVVEDSKGTVYTAGGGPAIAKAKIHAVDGAGKSRVFAEIEGAEITALALNAKDELFAATNPDGKVYRVSSGKAEVFYDPKAKYIWALRFDSRGRLYVATGDQGEIHRVEANGQGRVYFKLDEAHARSIAVDGQDRLLVGTEPGGLVLRVEEAGGVASGFVLYQSSKREITALAVSKSGAIYAAGVGQKLSPGVVAPVTVTPTPAVTAAPAGPPGAAQTQRIAVAPPPTLGPPAMAVTGGSELYQLDADGAAVKLYGSGTDVIYAIALDREGSPWIGTGNKGSIVKIESPYLYTYLPALSPTQITALVVGRNGRLLAATGNVGKLFGIGPEIEKEGTLESEVFDAGALAMWGRVSSDTKGAVKIETRSGNLERPQKNWSSWATLQEGRVASPPARFVQWRATLSNSGATATELRSVDVAYQTRNLRPRIEEVEATPQNYRFGTSSAVTLSSASPSSLSLAPLGRTRPRPVTVAPVVSDPNTSTPSTVNYAKGMMGARWLATDDNGDPLSFTVEIKGVGEANWKPVKDQLRDRYVTIDSTMYPDGEYVLRVTASDQPGNPPGQGLTAMLESEPFLIDNTPPAITNLTGEAAGVNLNVRWRVKDVSSVLTKVEYSINGGDWQVAEPTTKLTDSKEHEYRVVVARPGSGEVHVAVRATDYRDNTGVEKTLLKLTGQ